LVKAKKSYNFNPDLLNMLAALPKKQPLMCKPMPTDQKVPLNIPLQDLLNNETYERETGLFLSAKSNH